MLLLQRARAAHLRRLSQPPSLQDKFAIYEGVSPSETGLEAPFKKNSSSCIRQGSLMHHPKHRLSLLVSTNFGQSSPPTKNSVRSQPSPECFWNVIGQGILASRSIPARLANVLTTCSSTTPSNRTLSLLSQGKSRSSLE